MISPYWSSAKDEFSDRKEPILLWDEYGEPLLRQLYHPDGRTILDAGCGSGRLVEALLGAGWDAYGITYQHEEVEAFRARCPQWADRIHLGDLHQPPFLDGVFDVIVCWDVLEHTIAPLHVLGEFRRISKPGGRLVLFIPGQEWQLCNYHIIVPTVTQSIHLLRSSGWAVDVFWNASAVQDQCALYCATSRPVNVADPIPCVTVTRDHLFPPHGTAQRPTPS